MKGNFPERKIIIFAICSYLKSEVSNFKYEQIVDIILKFEVSNLLSEARQGDTSGIRE